MLSTKHDFSKFITKLFENETFKNYLANYASTTAYPHRSIALITGDILTFYAFTRSTNTSKELLVKIIHNATLISNSYENFSKIVYEEMVEQNKNATKNQIINKLIDNYITNGFYMHAFSSASLENILQRGLDPKECPFRKERDILNKVAAYEFDSCSNKLFVTGNYRILYSYGSLSPEWLYYYFKDSETMYNRDYNKAYSLFLQKAKKNLSSVRQLKEVSDTAKKVFSYYLKDNLNIQVAVVNRNAKNEHNELIFKPNSTDKGAVSFEEEINPKEFLQALRKKQYDKKDDNILDDIFKILLYFSPYENSSSTKFTREQFGLITLPSYKEFQKRMHQEKEPKTQEHTHTL